MTLNDYFDGIYCLTLPHRKEDRWEGNCLPQFKIQQINNVESVYGVLGKTLLLPNSNIEIPIYRLCELGSAMGHLNCIKKAKSDGVKKALIFEDDVCLIENINNKFDEIYNQIPDDFDILYFGGNHTGGLTKIDSNIYKTYRTFALQMYSVNYEFYDFLIDYLEESINSCFKKPEEKLKKYESWAGDWFISRLQPTINSYTIKPIDVSNRNFSWQMDDNFSDIQQDLMRYDFLKNN